MNTKKQETLLTQETILTQENSVKEVKQMTPIDLLEISQVILNTNEGLREKAREKPLIITAKSLVKKIPDFKILGDLPLIQLRFKNHSFQSLLPCLYQENKEVVVSLPDLNATITSDFTVISHKLGKYGYSILKYKDSDLLIKTSISVSDLCTYYYDEKIAENDDFDFEEIKGLPDFSFLKEYPKIVIPLINLPTDTELEIIGFSGKTNYNSDLLNIKGNNEVFNNVIANSELSKAYRNKGIGYKFKLGKSEEISQKYKEGKKEKTRLIQKIPVIPIIENDFSNLKV